MIAMQYRFVLPADYDMRIIRERIRDKGHLLDNYPELMFKAYLYADTQSREYPAPLNLYAPFYLWLQVQIEQKHALACLSAFDPHNWTLIRFSLYANSGDLSSDADCECYQVGYVAGPS